MPRAPGVLVPKTFLRDLYTSRLLPGRSGGRRRGCDASQVSAADNHSTVDPGGRATTKRRAGLLSPAIFGRQVMLRISWRIVRRKPPSRRAVKVVGAHSGSICHVRAFMLDKVRHLRGVHNLQSPPTATATFYFLSSPHAFPRCATPGGGASCGGAATNRPSPGLTGFYSRRGRRPDFRMRESCPKMPLVGGFSRGSPVSPRPFIPTPVRTHLASPLIGSQDLNVKSPPHTHRRACGINAAGWYYNLEGGEKAIETTPLTRCNYTNQYCVAPQWTAITADTRRGTQRKRLWMSFWDISAHAASMRVQSASVVAVAGQSSNHEPERERERSGERAGQGSIIVGRCELYAVAHYTSGTGPQAGSEQQQTTPTPRCNGCWSAGGTGIAWPPHAATPDARPVWWCMVQDGKVCSTAPPDKLAAPLSYPALRVSPMWGHSGASSASQAPRMSLSKEATNAIPQHVLARAFHNFWRRLHTFLEVNGGHFQHILQPMSRQSQSRVLQAPSRIVGFTRRFHTLSSIQATNTSLAVVPQSPVVVHTQFRSRTLGQTASIKDCLPLSCGNALAEKQFNVGARRLSGRSQRDRSSSSVVYAWTPASSRLFRRRVCRDNDTWLASDLSEAAVTFSTSTLPSAGFKLRTRHGTNYQTCLQCAGVAVAERLACSTPTSRLGIAPDGCRWSAGFLGDLPFPPPSHSGAAPFSLYFTLIGSQDLDVKIHPNLSTRIAAFTYGTFSGYPGNSGACLQLFCAFEASKRVSFKVDSCSLNTRLVASKCKALQLACCLSVRRRRKERRRKREIPEKTRRPTASSGTIPTCENQGVARPGIKPGSSWWEASTLTAQAPWPPNEGGGGEGEKTNLIP
ncbi:hypothetical protein PR048_033482 [Dryococelus australis]|uniref:Uncharacterized protein n=1 Tax=Dryococelus australis TaxID=614101 RepID=A0ABQ9G0E3_9NEOP|nr:hypothetical protein PR048_033482 [Dryococelus australis]